MFQYDGAAFQFNLSGIVKYNKKYGAALEYRFQDAVISWPE